MIKLPFPSEPEDPDMPDITRRQQTKLFSTEFLITMALQTGVFLVMGTLAFSAVSARVAALESQQVTDARIARIEEKMSTILVNQQEFKATVQSIEREVRAQRRE